MTEPHFSNNYQFNCILNGTGTGHSTESRCRPTSMNLTPRAITNPQVLNWVKNLLAPTSKRVFIAEFLTPA